MSILVGLLAVLVAAVAARDESFHEELLFAPLATNDIMSHFRFTTLVPTKSASFGRDFDLLSRFVGELRDAYDLEEFSLSLARGVWNEERWGYAPESVPPGAEVSAWFGAGVAESDVWASWRSLTNALSGQLCASLNFLDQTTSASPKYSFTPRGVSNISKSDGVGYGGSKRFMRGTLPGENVCTENLTPWKKMLPCQGKRGLATLLNAGHVHKTKYHALGLRFRRVCPKGGNSCSHPDIEFTQTLTLVSDPSILHENVDNKSPASWSIRSLFGIGLTSTCPVASTSNIYFDMTRDLFEIQPTPKKISSLDSGSRKIAVYDLNQVLDEGVANLIVNNQKPTVYGLIPRPNLHATRYVIGHGQEKGGIVTKLRNNAATSQRIVFLDVLPWYLRCYLHTLSLRNDKARGGLLKPLVTDFRPGKDRDRPYVLELVVELPAKSETLISIEFEKSLLKWLEYPPDANRGFDVGSAVISAVLPGRKNFTGLGRRHSTFAEAMEADDSGEGGEAEHEAFYQLHTEKLLVNLPTPDFSMPYNVICLACTVVALAFGPLHNITTKNLQVVSPGTEEKGYLGNAVDKIKSLFRLAVEQVNALFGRRNEHEVDGDVNDMVEEESERESESDSGNTDE